MLRGKVVGKKIGDCIDCMFCTVLRGYFINDALFHLELISDSDNFTALFLLELISDSDNFTALFLLELI